MLTHQIDILDSGLTVIRVPMNSLESVTVMALANTGSRYETASQQGIAHFFEHMVFKGTDKFPTAQDLAVAVDSVGADFNAFTSKEFTGYYVQAASKHLQLALDVVSDMILAPKLRQDDIDREKGVIVEEINMYLDSPARHIGDVFERMAFAGSGLEHDIIGSKETVNQLTSQNFKDFLSKWYGLSNMILVIAGDASIVKKEVTLDLINQLFAKEGGKRSDQKIDLNPYLSGKKGPISSQRFHLEKKTTEQAHFILGWPAIKRNDPRKYAISLLSIVMGGNMSSRLFSEIREKRGLCYYIHASSDEYHDGGLLSVAAGVDPNRVYQALELVMAEFNALANGSKKITQQELQASKDFIAGKMALSFEDSQSVAQYFGSRQLLMGEIETPDEVLAKVNQVTLDQVQTLAEEIIKGKSARLAIIGNFEDKIKFEKIINL